MYVVGIVVKRAPRSWIVRGSGWLPQWYTSRKRRLNQGTKNEGGFRGIVECQEVEASWVGEDSHEKDDYERAGGTTELTRA